MDNPFDMIVYDKDLSFAGFVVDPIYAYFVPSWENQGYGSFMLAADNPHTEALQAKGARITCQYRGEHLMSGPIRSRRGDLAGGGETLIYQMLDDHRLFENTLATVNPDHVLRATSLTDLGQAWHPGTGASAPGTVTGQTPYFQWPSTITTSEEAIKYVITKNLVTRLGRNVTVLPNQGRGGNPTAILPVIRMESVMDSIQPILNFSGLGVKAWQEPYGTTIFIDVVEPGTWAQTLTPESGVIVNGTYSIAAPTLTRPIIGGSGETSSRVFAGIEGTGNRTQDEVDYNDVIEVFSEAPAFTFNWPSGLADNLKVAKYYPFQATAPDAALFATFMAKAITDALPSGAARSTLGIQLAETDTFHFGGSDGVQIGDNVTVRASGETFHNQVTEAQVDFTRDKGLTVIPLIGQAVDDPDVQLAIALANVAKALRLQSTRK